MNVIRKDATITNTDTDDAFPGTFEVILSAPTKDRDGETLATDEWKQPLPDHITFDADHGMSVASTVGSGKPRIDEKGNLRVTGTYSSLPRAQEVRTLVKEGHINRTSVAYMTEKTQKDGKSVVQRELLNGAFVAIPSNREAVVLDVKAAIKAGARNSVADQEHIQAIHDHAIALGATAGDAKSFLPEVQAKAVAGSYEQTQQAISDALSVAYPREAGDDRWVYAYPVATFPGTVVFRISGDTDQIGQWQADYTTNDDGTITLGTAERVNLVEQIVPVSGGTEEDAASAVEPDPAAAAEKAAAAGTVTTAVEDDSIAQQVAAKQRHYALINGRN